MHTGDGGATCNGVFEGPVLDFVEAVGSGGVHLLRGAGEGALVVGKIFGRHIGLCAFALCDGEYPERESPGITVGAESRTLAVVHPRRAVLHVASILVEVVVKHQVLVRRWGFQRSVHGGCDFLCGEGTVIYTEFIDGTVPVGGSGTDVEGGHVAETRSGGTASHLDTVLVEGHYRTANGDGIVMPCPALDDSRRGVHQFALVADAEAAIGGCLDLERGIGGTESLAVVGQLVGVHPPADGVVTLAFGKGQLRSLHRGTLLREGQPVARVGIDHHKRTLAGGTAGTGTVRCHKGQIVDTGLLGLECRVLSVDDDGSRCAVQLPLPLVGGKLRTVGEEDIFAFLHHRTVDVEVGYGCHLLHADLLGCGGGMSGGIGDGERHIVGSEGLVGGTGTDAPHLFLHSTGHGPYIAASGDAGCGTETDALAGADHGLRSGERGIGGGSLTHTDGGCRGGRVTAVVGTGELHLVLSGSGKAYRRLFSGSRKLLSVGHGDGPLKMVYIVVADGRKGYGLSGGDCGRRIDGDATCSGGNDEGGIGGEGTARVGGAHLGMVSAHAVGHEPLSVGILEGGSLEVGNKTLREHITIEFVAGVYSIGRLYLLGGTYAVPNPDFVVVASLVVVSRRRTIEDKVAETTDTAIVRSGEHAVLFAVDVEIELALVDDNGDVRPFVECKGRGTD